MPVGKAQLQGPCRDYSLHCFYWQAADFQEKHENARTFAFGCISYIPKQQKKPSLLAPTSETKITCPLKNKKAKGKPQGFFCHGKHTARHRLTTRQRSDLRALGEADLMALVLPHLRGKNLPEQEAQEAQQPKLGPGSPVAIAFFP